MKRLPTMAGFLRRTANVTQSRSLCRATNPDASWDIHTTKLEFVNGVPDIPCYRVMDEHGVILEKEPEMDKDTTIRVHDCMVKTHVMDKIFYEAQRQGRISFYMTSTGEEATVIGSAAALEDSDLVFSQYREQGVLMYRGWSIRQFADQCASNEFDIGKGRQMPVHYGSREHSFVTVSSPLATQIPHAAGAAYAFKVLKGSRVVVTYFGEGAASEGDFHAGVNFASVLGGPGIFFCRNNKFAISTHHTDQFGGDGIAPRGLAFGMNTIRVDGNDVFAVYEATKAARQLTLETQKPVMIEAMSYRVGHHSTSDDSSRYRPSDEVKSWMDRCPIKRLQAYMLERDWVTETEIAQLEKQVQKDCVKSLVEAEKSEPPHHSELFNDVYDVIPPHLLEQQEALAKHMDANPGVYAKVI
eukprot:TRINITY_DN938_c0_g1_i4.p1 TRINITY_DN938_c0_g1~~TRINITY_DN938_c0_g1_i4.p1  ORF type:complete len:413 (+),score=102.41 TRINITY_DN938_c0_g1_i4:123-1361(+)